MRVRVTRDRLVHSNRNAEKWRRTNLKSDVVPQVLAQARALRRVERAAIWVGVIKGNRNRYDPANLTDSMKPAVDALVKAGVLPDDSFRFTRGPWLMHLGYNARLRDVVEFIVCVTSWADGPEEVRAAMGEFARTK